MQAENFRDAMPQIPSILIKVDGDWMQPKTRRGAPDLERGLLFFHGCPPARGAELARKRDRRKAELAPEISLEPASQ